VTARLVACTAAAGLAAIAAGCGGGGSDATRSRVDLTAQERHGRDVFVRRCGVCHTLSDAGTHGTVGKDLDATKPSAAIVLRSLAVPPQNMPTGLVTNAADAKAVAAYVVAVTRAR